MAEFLTVVNCLRECSPSVPDAVIVTQPTIRIKNGALVLDVGVHVREDMGQGPGASHNGVNPRECGREVPTRL